MRPINGWWSMRRNHEKELSRAEALLDVAKQQMQSTTAHVARWNAAISELARAIRETQTLADDGGEKELVNALQRRQQELMERRDQAQNAVQAANQNVQKAEARCDKARTKRDKVQSDVDAARKAVEKRSPKWNDLCCPGKRKTRRPVRTVAGDGTGMRAMTGVSP